MTVKQPMRRALTGDVVEVVPDAVCGVYFGRDIAAVPVLQLLDVREDLVPMKAADLVVAKTIFIMCPERAAMEAFPKLGRLTIADEHLPKKAWFHQPVVPKTKLGRQRWQWRHA
jgi:hypothetical protein